MPHIILQEIHESFQEKFYRAEGSNESMDFSLLYIPNCGKTVYLSSAKGIVFVKRGNDIHLMDSQRISIGHPDQTEKFETCVLRAKRGDVLFITSDGFQDQFGGLEGKKLKRSGLIEILKNIEDHKFDEFGSYLKQRFDQWRGLNEQVDDVTVFGIHCRGELDDSNERVCIEHSNPN